jgi:hypothetical protein
MVNRARGPPGSLMKFAARRLKVWADAFELPPKPPEGPATK